MRAHGNIRSVACLDAIGICISGSNQLLAGKVPVLWTCPKGFGGGRVSLIIVWAELSAKNALATVKEVRNLNFPDVGGLILRSDTNAHDCRCRGP